MGSGEAPGSWRQRLRSAFSIRSSAAQAAAIEHLGLLADDLDSFQMLERIAAEAQRSMAADRVEICLRDRDEGDEAVIVAAAGRRGIGPELLRLWAPLLWDELERATAIAVDDVEAIAPLVSRTARGEISRAAIGPVGWSGNIQGMIIVGGLRAARTKLDAVSQFAQLSTLALDRSQLREQADQALLACADALITALDIRDPYTADHSDSVVGIAIEVGRRCGLTGETLVELELSARLHDVGKLGVPDEILHKNGPLDDEEWVVMRRHPDWGAAVISKIPGLERIAEIVRCEHEHWDGGGYPRGLGGESIPLAARIILTCDAFHAMTSDRPYRKGCSEEHAITELRRHAGTQFDPATVDALVAVVTSPVVVAAPTATVAAPPRLRLA